ncbi:MAG: prolyl oligopeptidase family serine peptidase [Bacteroidales bacterium]|nr:prolyl oligopeptidase family serine peptidase [Bacteroidales bacterium]
MKKAFLLFLLCASLITKAQNSFTGTWQGYFSVEGIQFLMILNIEEDENDKISATMHIPQQMLLNYDVLKISTEDDSLWMKAAGLRADYAAILDRDSLRGTWTQMGVNYVINLGLTPEDEAFSIRRPQTPQEPYTYYCEDVKFYNKKAKIWLAGTLTLPDTTHNWPVVVLVSGSGPQDRNEELLEHKPFLVIADYFTRNGIGVLRYDDRGIGKSEGKFADATTIDLASDAESAIDFLSKKEFVNKDQIGLAGHSEGGIIAMMLGSNKKLLFAISMAGVGVPCDQLLVMQQDKMYEGYGGSEEMREVMWNFNSRMYNIVQTEKDPVAIRTGIETILAETTERLTEEEIKEYGLSDNYIIAILSQISNPWFKTFVTLKPAKYIEKIKIHFLAINGSTDRQVPAEENIEAIKIHIKQKKGQIVDYKIFDGLNHLFQNSKSGMPTEYAMIDETINEEVLEYMMKWIKKVLEN